MRAAAAMLLLVTGVAVARAADPTLAQRADALFRAADWTGAAEAYATITSAEPGNAEAWFRLGQSRHELARFAEAVAAFDRAAAAGYNPGVVKFRRARSLARHGEVDAAFAQLDELLGRGFSQLPLLRDHVDFAALRADARWADVLARAERNLYPCQLEPAHRGFDFWLGEWDVRTPTGDRAGESRVESILGGCILLENWSGTNGYAGKSFNSYDPQAKQWRQVWVDSVGAVTDFRGELRDGNLYYTTSARQPDGREVQRKMTFFALEPGKVRQLGESSSDGGLTWTTDYDLLYKRKK